MDLTVRLDKESYAFGYFSQEQMEIFGKEDERRMIANYNPERELVTILLKPEERISSYRIGIPGEHWVKES